MCVKRGPSVVVVVCSLERAVGQLPKVPGRLLVRGAKVPPLASLEMRSPICWLFIGLSSRVEAETMPEYPIVPADWATQIQLGPPDLAADAPQSKEQRVAAGSTVGQCLG